MEAGRIGVKLRGASAHAAPGVEDSADSLPPEKGKYTLQQTTVSVLWALHWECTSIVLQARIPPFHAYR